MTCNIGKRCPRRRLPKALIAAGMMATTATTATTAVTMTAETLAMTTLLGCI
jgi:hypothetical protein